MMKRQELSVIANSRKLRIPIELVVAEMYRQSPLEQPVAVALPYISKLLRFYVHKRRMGLNLNIVRGTDPAGCLFSALWTWRSKLNADLRVWIADTIELTHEYVLRRRAVMSRTEFAFLTIWRGSLNWAERYKPLYLDARHGMDELFDLVATVEPEHLLRAFSGVELENRLAWTTQARPPESDWVCTQLGLVGDLFETVIAPIEGSLSCQLQSFVQRF